MLDRAHPSVNARDLLLIFNDIPERIALSEYEDLLPHLSPSSASKSVGNRGKDWSDEFVSIYDESDQILDRRTLVDWIHERILAFESVGFLENGLRLCEYALDNEHLEELASTRRHLSLQFLLNQFCDQDLTLNEMQMLSVEEIFEKIFTFKVDFHQDDVDKRVEQVLVPSLQLIPRAYEDLEEVLIKKLQANADVYPIVRSIKFQSIFEKKQVEEMIRHLILKINSINQIGIGQQLLTLIDDKQDLEEIIE